MFWASAEKADADSLASFFVIEIEFSPVFFLHHSVPSEMRE